MPAPDPAETRPEPPVGVTCSFCGTPAVTAPLTWIYEVDSRRGGRWVCDRCARTHLRAIEAKLDQEWW